MNPASFDLKGRVALVTGATGFLGQEHCDALAEIGASVVVVDLNADDCRKQAAELSKRRGVKALGLGVDITDAAAVKRMMAHILAEFSRVDVLINNAQLKLQATYVPFSELKLEDWNRVFEVNLTGAFLCCQAVEAPMKAQGGGSVINMGSIYGVVAPDQRIYEGTPFNTPVTYPVTKAGMYGLMRYLATYWAKDRIRVNAITPGGVFNNHTDPFHSAYCNRVPMGRMGERHELRGAVQYLASDASSYVTGHNLVVDGGWTVW